MPDAAGLHFDKGRLALKTLPICAALVVLLPLALSACEEPPAAGNSAGEAAETAQNGATSAPPAAAPSAAPTAAAPLVLDAAGLSGAGDGATLAFGAPAQEAVDFVAKALGGAPTERGTNEECGGGPLDFATWQDRIVLHFEEGRFAGWDARGALKTRGGIGVGSSRSDLEALPGLEVEDSTLGVEFRAGELGGILSSRAPDGKVTALWAGATCAFR